ncbi:REP-associated tyrosine transposase [Thermotalea metallivorans]|uniref:Transposase IS200-like domain-containing protein n=1 Tax=Thermotalea metallivorans TaxID=520762 RepID=A0A140L500_9FIRM|nr:transposase [Thermotalea metallivorans]KXG75625.1 hypothetical protein AN619_16210 [Thermotalea metallivorans]
MPRYRRLVSKAGIYHVMMRGNEKKNIFHDHEDRHKFICILSDKKKISEYELYAYCLMNNHVHLLIKESKEPLAQCMKRINTSYAYYFNRKYQRVGHVFQDRFKSEPIEDENYLLAAIQYIHNNPVQAQLVNNCRDYPWSSYNSYINEASKSDAVDREFILSLFSQNPRQAIILFEQFSAKDNTNCFLDIMEKSENEKIILYGYLEGKKYAEEFLGKKKLSIEDLKCKVNKHVRDELIGFLKFHSNLSIREIANILSLNRGVIDRIKL